MEANILLQSNAKVSESVSGRSVIRLSAANNRDNAAAAITTHLSSDKQGRYQRYAKSEPLWRRRPNCAERSSAAPTPPQHLSANGRPWIGGEPANQKQEHLARGSWNWWQFRRRRTSNCNWVYSTWLAVCLFSFADSDSISRWQQIQLVSCNNNHLSVSHSSVKQQPLKASEILRSKSLAS